MIIAVIVICCLVCIFFVYAGYPLIMAGWACCCRRRSSHLKHAGAQNAGPEKQACSIVIAVHNDAPLLLRKLQALPASEDGWIDEILVGSDGSDDIAQLEEAIRDPRLKVIPFKQRRGKTAVLNDVVPRCRNEIVVMMDARQLVEQGTVPALLARFSDPQVGVVSGELVFRDEENGGTLSDGSGSAADGMGAYWHYEKWIRKNEAAAASVPGATGACYAIRKSLFRPVPAETVLDDVAYPMQAVMQGYRCVFEEKAVVYDTPSRHSRQETIRKRRTLAGNVQLIRYFSEWLLPGRNPIAFQFISHKVLRLFVPFLMIIAAGLSVAGAFLTRSVPLFLFFAAVSFSFIAFFICCTAGALFEQRGIKNRFFALCWMFFVLNRVTLLGVFDGLLVRHRADWEKAYDNR